MDRLWSIVIGGSIASACAGMPRQIRRRLPAPQRKESIARAAIPLLARKGFDGTTTRELAAAAGVSEALLFRHFPTKDQLNTEIYEHLSHSAEIDYARAASLPPSTETLVRVVYFLMHGVVIKRAADSDAAMRLLYRSFVEDGRYGRSVFRGPRMASLRRQFESSLAAAHDAGDVVDVGVPAPNLFWYSHHIASLICLVRLGDPPAIRYQGGITTIVAETAQFALRGIGLTPAAAARYATIEQFDRWRRDPELTLLTRLEA